jgi:hypothetical protein
MVDLPQELIEHIAVYSEDASFRNWRAASRKCCPIFTPFAFRTFVLQDMISSIDSRLEALQDDFGHLLRFIRHCEMRCGHEPNGSRGCGLVLPSGAKLTNML